MRQGQFRLGKDHLLALSLVLGTLTGCAAGGTSMLDDSAQDTQLTSEPSLPPTSVSGPAAAPTLESLTNLTAEPIVTAQLNSTASPTRVALTDPSALLGQQCLDTSHSSFQTCTTAYCCETSVACSADPNCAEAERCFQQNGGMRGYGGISACYTLPGATMYMRLFACRFQYCGQYMTLNTGELCLTEACPLETAGCFSNPDCFALKFCIVDGIGSRADCSAIYPAGVADFDRWNNCGTQSGCFAQMP